MTPRERILRALNHGEPDRVPIDLGGTLVTTVTRQAYKSLRGLLGLPADAELEVAELVCDTVRVQEDVLRRYRIDTRPVYVRDGSLGRLPVEALDRFEDPYGVVWKRASYYFDAVERPLKEGTLQELERAQWEQVGDRSTVAELGSTARRLYETTGYCLVADIPAAGPFEGACTLRGYENFLVDLHWNPRYALRLMERVLETALAKWELILAEAGAFVQVAAVGDDVAMQTGTYVSTEMYRRMIKPLHRKLFDFIHSRTRAKVFLHSCGSVYDLIADFIDVGVDVLNPVQRSAARMDISGLKGEFGRDISFWGGGIDIQSQLRRKKSTACSAAPPSSAAEGPRRKRMRLSKLSVLSEKEIAGVHEASLRILGRAGVQVGSQAVRQRLKRHGCSLREEDGRVLFPARLVERALRALPRQIQLRGRDGRPALTLGDGQTHCASGHNAVFMLEDRSGRRRASGLRDVRGFAALSDRLEEIEVVGIPVCPQDAPARTALLHAIRAVVENTQKPVYFSTDEALINRAAIDMSEAVAGPGYMISQLSPTSPLYWEAGAAESVLECAARGVPLAILPAPIAGMTSPYTLAGLLAMHNAEMLSGILIAQLARPGAAVISATAWLTGDMRYSNALVGRPEAALLRVAAAQMAHFYGAPSHTTSPESDANLPDEQMAWEKSLSTVAGLAAGNDLIMNLGMFGAGMTVSLEQLVLDHELCRIVKRFVRGLTVDGETLAVSTIEEIGPRGTFLMSDHTLRHLRTGEHLELELTNSDSFGAWQEKGGPDVFANASARVQQLLEQGPRSALEADVSRRLGELIRRVEAV